MLGLSEMEQIRHVGKREPREQSKPGKAGHAVMQESAISLRLNIPISHRVEQQAQASALLLNLETLFMLWLYKYLLVCSDCSPRSYLDT